MMTLLLAFILAFAAGYAVRRGSICLVRATEEMMTNKPNKTLWFIIEAALVAFAITVPALVFYPESVNASLSHPLSPWLLGGALLFGVGAAVNGSCSLGTLNHLGQGNLNFLGTIFGLTVGFVVSDRVGLLGFDMSSNAVSTTSFDGSGFMMPFLVFVWVFFIWRFYQYISQSRENRRRKIDAFLTSSVARDHIGVMVLGLSSGLLYLLLGQSWDYTSWVYQLQQSITYDVEANKILSTLNITVAALIAGVAIAAINSNDFKVVGVEMRPLMEKVLGGLLMGMGASFIPGGNDTLILYNLPGLAIHVPFAIAFMMVGIWIALKTKQALAKI